MIINKYTDNHIIYPTVYNRKIHYSEYSRYDAYLYYAWFAFMLLFLYRLNFLMYMCISILYNLVYNQTFYKYVYETQNYLLLLFPLYHKPLDVSTINVGFVSYIFPQCAVVIYIHPTYRKQGYFTQCVQSFTGYIFTNNTNVVQYLQKYHYTLLINIPYFRILQKLPYKNPKLNTNTALKL